MTQRQISFAAALGFLAASLVAAVPATAGSLAVAKPVMTADQHADLHLVDHGSWKKKQYFKHKKHYFKRKKHLRGDHYYYGGGHGDHSYKHRKKRKHRHAYRHGYEDGYYDGRHEGRHDGYYKRGYGYSYGKSPYYRNRGHHYRHHRFGSGYIKTPGFYFRF